MIGIAYAHWVVWGVECGRVLRVWRAIQGKGQNMFSTVATPSSSVFNSDELLARCMGNASFAERVLAKFLDRCALDLEELTRAAESRDANAIAATAHRIKGAAANVAAKRLRERAAVIEDLGRAARLGDVPENITSLQQEWTDFVQAAAVLELGSYSAI